jgi:hypothetical protein
VPTWVRTREGENSNASAVTTFDARETDGETARLKGKDFVRGEVEATASTMASMIATWLHKGPTCHCEKKNPTKGVESVWRHDKSDVDALTADSELCAVKNGCLLTYKLKVSLTRVPRDRGKFDFMLIFICRLPQVVSCHLPFLLRPDINASRAHSP